MREGRVHCEQITLRQVGEENRHPLPVGHGMEGVTVTEVQYSTFWCDLEYASWILCLGLSFIGLSVTCEKLRTGRAVLGHICLRILWMQRKGKMLWALRVACGNRAWIHVYSLMPTRVEPSAQASIDQSVDIRKTIVLVDLTDGCLLMNCKLNVCVWLISAGHRCKSRAPSR